MNLRIPKMKVIYTVTEKLLHSKDGLYSVVLVVRSDECIIYKFIHEGVRA